MPVPAHLSTFWSEFAKATGGADEERFYEAFFFGDSEAMANELAELVLRGTKRATAGALWPYEAEGQRLPQPGDLSIVTDWSGSPLCVIQTQSVEVVPFREVTAEFAATEGEGDGSLAFWQRAHKEFFSRECAAAGREFTESMQVVCERFAVVYRPSTSAAQPFARVDLHRQAAWPAHRPVSSSAARAKRLPGVGPLSSNVRRRNWHHPCPTSS